MLAFRKNLHRGGGAPGADLGAARTAPATTTGAGRSGDGASPAGAAAARPTGPIDGELPTAAVSESAPETRTSESFDSAYDEAQDAYEAEALRLTQDDGFFSDDDRRALALKYGTTFQPIHDAATAEEDGRYAVASTSDLQTIAELKQDQTPDRPFNERAAPRWQPLQQTVTVGTQQVPMSTTKGTSVADALEFDNETGRLKPIANNPRALTEADVLGLVRTQVNGFDRMSDEQQRLIFQEILGDADSNEEYLERINALYSGEIDIPQHLYDPAQSERGGRIDDRSDVFVLNQTFSGIEESERQTAMAQYEELRKDWTPEQRWNFAHNCKDPQIITDSIQAKDGEGQPLKHKDVFKRGREAVKGFGDTVALGYQDAAEKVSAAGERVKARLSEEAVQEQVALEQAIPLTEQRQKDALARARDAETYRKYYEQHVLPLENARDVLSGQAASQKAALDGAAATLETTQRSAETALSEFGALTDEQFGGADKKAAYTAALTELRAAYAANDPAAIAAAESALDALGVTPDAIQAAFVKAKGALADEHTALLSKKSKQDAYDKKAGEIIGTDGRSLADIEEALRGLSETRTQKRGTLTSEDVEAIESGVGISPRDGVDDAGRYIAGLKELDDIIGEELQTQKDRMKQLEADTHYFEDRGAYDAKRAQFEQLVGDMENYHLQEVAKGLKSLTGKKYDVGLDDLTPEGLVQRDARVEAERKRLEKSIDHAQKLVLDEPAEWVGKSAELVGSIKTGAEAARELGLLFAGVDKDFNAIYDRIGARMGKMADDINQKSGARRDKLLTDFEKFKGLYKKAETQSATQKAAHDRAFGEKASATARKEARVGVGRVDPKEAQALQALADANDKNTKATKTAGGKDIRYYNQATYGIPV